MLPEPALVVTPAAGSWRRDLVPTAWLVLEELAIGASEEGLLSTNVRRLGAALGLSKDTVARALRVLIAAGLVERVDERDGASGRFGAVVYLVDRASAGLRITDALMPVGVVSALEPEPGAVPDNSCPRATQPRSRRPTRQSAPVSNIEQLDLFEARQ